MPKPTYPTEDGWTLVADGHGGFMIVRRKQYLGHIPHRAVREVLQHLARAFVRVGTS